MLYSEKVMDHLAHPRNVGEMENADAIGEVGNMKCGDIMKIYLKIDENEVIQDVKFQTFGCGAAVAEALDGLPPVKMHCSVLAEEAVKSALEDYYKRQGKDPADYMTPVSGHCEDCCQQGQEE